MIIIGDRLLVLEILTGHRVAPMANEIEDIQNHSESLSDHAPTIVVGGMFFDEA